MTLTKLGLRRALIVAASIVVCACGTSAPSSPLAPVTGGTQPQPICSYDMSVTSVAMASAGGAVSVTVRSAEGCTWTASSAASFFTVSTSTGIGTGTVTITAAPNTGAARTGTVIIAGQTVTVTQGDGTPVTVCAYSVSRDHWTLSAEEQRETFNVSTQPGCLWTAAVGESFVTIESGATGSGNGTVALIASRNTGNDRRAVLSVAGYTIPIDQAAPAACSYAVAAPDLAPIIAAAGKTLLVGVTTTTACPWTASSPDSWILVSSGTNYSGSGAATLVIAANAASAPARVGSVTIAGQTITVSQAAGAAICTFTLGTSEIQSPLTPAAATVHVTVTTTPGCAWNAVSQTGWLTVTGGASGSGSGTVTMTVAANTLPNPGPPGTLRIAFVTIAGQLRSVAQYYQ